MDPQAMLTRDLVLRLCADATEFDRSWLAEGGKTIVPYLATRDVALVHGIVEGAREMGAARILVARTRAEYAYDPVVAMAPDTDDLVDLIRDWGERPTDFLVALEDLSGAVLVTASELTVAAGPVPFLRALIGPDLGRARTAFAEHALDRQDTSLIQTAIRYGCLEPGARHARTPRVPRPDLAERLVAGAARMRDTSPGGVAVLRVLRSAAAWAMVILIASALVLAAGLDSALPVLLGLGWLVLLTATLARSRTVAFSVLLRMVAFGAAFAPVIGLAEVAIATAAGLPVTDRFTAVYVGVPVEELGKLAPLLLFRLFAKRRFARFAAVDYLLLGVAAGAGFQLAEGAVAAVTGAVLPPAGSYGPLLPGAVAFAGTYFAGHAITTGLAAGAIGLAVVGRRRLGYKLWLLPPLALGLAALDHVALNAAASGLRLTRITGVVHEATGSGRSVLWLLVVFLVAGIVLDHHLARTVDDAVPPLPGSSPWAGLARRARGRAIQRRAAIPSDISPLFQRFARVRAGLPASLSLTLAELAHEVVVALVAAARGPATLVVALRLLRERREVGMGAYRARGRPRRDAPPRAELWSAREWLVATLLPGAAVVAVLVGLVLGGWARWVEAVRAAVWPGAAPSGTAGPAYLPLLADDLGRWLEGFSPTGQNVVIAAAVSALLLLAFGWGTPHDVPTSERFLHDPWAAILAVLGLLAPGQLGHLLLGLLGRFVPRALIRTLYGDHPPPPDPPPPEPEDPDPEPPQRRRHGRTRGRRRRN